MAIPLPLRFAHVHDTRSTSIRKTFGSSSLTSIKRERSRSPRRRSRSPRHDNRRSYSPRSRSRSRGEYRRRERSRSGGERGGAANTGGGYSAGYQQGRGSAAPPRSFEDRTAAKEQMVSAVRDSSQQDRRVYVGNLSYDVKWGHLKDFMRQCRVSSARPIVRTRAYASTAGEVLFADVLTLPNGMSKVGNYL